MNERVQKVLGEGATAHVVIVLALVVCVLVLLLPLFFFFGYVAGLTVLLGDWDAVVALLQTLL